MEDILSQGGDKDPSPWPRRLTAIAPLLVVVVGALVYLSLARHHAPVASHAAAVTPGATEAPTALNLPPGPNGIAGPNLAWDPSLRLPAAGTRPVWFSPASGSAQQIAGLPADQSGYQFIRVAGGWAVQASTVSPAGCGTCAGPSGPVWFLADGARSVTRIGTANLAAPAAAAGAVWLTSYQRGVNTTTAAGTAQEVNVKGALTRPVTLPAGYAIGQGTDRGLLLAPVTRQPEAAADRLWNPAAPRTSQVFDGVLAASPDEIAWIGQCTPQCTVKTLNLATGKRANITLSPGNSAVSGAFSPDGSLLALQMSFGNTGDGGDLAMQLEVASTTTGQLTLVPGTWVSSDALVGFGWPTSGDRLVAEFNFTTKTQLASWSPGAARPAVTVVRPGPDQAALVLG